MSRSVWIAAIGLYAALVGLAPGQQTFDARALFKDPAPLKDADGRDLVTGKALASPYGADFDDDGVNDLVIGGHISMDSMEGGIWLARNVATNKEPRFDWKNAWKVQLADGSACTPDCGCKMAGYVPVQAVDWNNDGWMDLVYSDTYRRCFILINTRTSRSQPTFERIKYFDFGKANHAMYCGGGDWNGDGVRDFLYMPYGGQSYLLFAGRLIDGKGLKFADGPVASGRDLKITGQKAGDCAWAWDFSGTCKAGQIEYVGTEGESREINFYKVTDGVSRRLGTLAVSDGKLPKITACDLNADRCMDVMYASGVFEKPKVTKVYVMYGRVRNIRAPGSGVRGPGAGVRVPGNDNGSPPASQAELSS
jgi:hypothetical protein